MNCKINRYAIYKPHVGIGVPMGRAQIHRSCIVGIAIISWESQYLMGTVIISQQ
jgi:hypothetical protein